MTTSNNTLASVEKTIEILHALKRNNGMRVAETADVLNIPSSTAHAHLSTLYEAEVVTKEGDQYVLGSTCVEFGEYVKYRKEAYRLAEQYTKQLFEETEYRSVFMIEEHGCGIYLHTYSGSNRNWKHEKSGTKEPLHTVAAGKAILSELPREDVDAIIDEQGLTERTDNTIVERGRLHNELETIREQGYAQNDEENLDGIRAVGAPVVDPNGRVVGSFSLAGAANRMTDEQFDETLPELLLATVNEYKLDLFLS